jgi:DNA modification methylase
MEHAIEMLDPETLAAYKNNSRTHSGGQIKQIEESIKEFGFTNPVLLDKNNEIIAGHGRVLASKKMGIKKVPCIRLSHLTEQQKRAYVIADNQLALNAGWDENILSLEIGELSDNDFDISLLGFNDLELNGYLLKEFEGLTDEDEVPEPPVEPVTKLGDIWKLGNHRLMCGDSTMVDNLDKLCPEQADMIFTDPPYGMAYGGGRAEGSTKKGALVKAHGMIKNDNLKNDDLTNLVKDSLIATLLKTKKGCATYICFIWRTYTEFNKAIKEAGIKIKNCIVWDKKSIGLGQSNYRPQHEFIFYGGENWYGDKSQSDVWYSSRGDTGKYVHPTQKPIELIIKAINNSSKNEDVIIDCFGGSGSTVIACEKTNRKARLMELDPKYCDVIVKRWENFTGKKAELANG